MGKTLWILGAADPELRVIQDLLAQVGEQVAYAASPGRDGGFVRVGPGQAYKAEGVLVPWAAPTDEHLAGAWADEQEDARTPRPPRFLESKDALQGWDDLFGRVVLVECDLPGHPREGLEVVVVDHHRPGDPGFGRDSEEFLPASSVGQVISLLAEGGALPGDWSKDGVAYLCPGRTPGELAFQLAHESGVACSREEGGGGIFSPDRWLVGVPDQRHTGWNVRVVPDDFLLAAAADHCLEAAYRGRCPGVDPDALGRWRAETRAAYQGRTVEDVLRDVAAARVALAAAPRVRIDDTAVADLRNKEVPELPEAATRDGTPYLAMPRPTERDPRKKVTLGAASPEVVREFLESWASAHGLVELYGDPARGLAGGYVVDTCSCVHDDRIECPVHPLANCAPYGECPVHGQGRS